MRQNELKKSNQIKSRERETEATSMRLELNTPRDWEKQTVKCRNHNPHLPHETEWVEEINPESLQRIRNRKRRQWAQCGNKEHRNHPIFVMELKSPGDWEKHSQMQKKLICPMRQNELNTRKRKRRQWDWSSMHPENERSRQSNAKKNHHLPHEAEWVEEINPKSLQREPEIESDANEQQCGNKERRNLQYLSMSGRHPEIERSTVKCKKKLICPMRQNELKKCQMPKKLILICPMRQNEFKHSYL